MSKNIYDLLNDIQLDIENYPKEEITTLEKMRLLKAFKASRKTTKPLARKWTVAAVSILILVNSVLILPVLANSNPIIHDIVHFFGIEKEIADYETIVNESVTKESITMQVTSVIIDNDNLHALIQTTSQNDISSNFTGTLGFLYINGEVTNHGVTSKNELFDNHTGYTLLTFPLSQSYSGDLDVLLKLTRPIDSESKQSPHWNFEFTASADKLMAETIVHPISRTISLPNGGFVTLNDFYSNPVYSYIKFSETSVLADNTAVRGITDHGEVVDFYWSITTNGEGQMNITNDTHINLLAANTVTLHLYVNDEPVGEAFIIDLK